MKVHCLHGNFAQLSFKIFVKIKFKKKDEDCCQRIKIFESRSHTLYPGCNIFVYIADQKQPNTSRARMDCGKLTLFLLLQALKRGVASQNFAEKHSVPTFMFRHK